MVDDGNLVMRRALGFDLLSVARDGPGLLGSLSDMVEAKKKKRLNRLWAKIQANHQKMSQRTLKINDDQST